ncbi:hypothetical protein CHUAL_004880 [Chamberlinius hualienensis]
MYGFAILLSFILLLFVCVHTVNWKWKIMHYFMSIVILIIWLMADYIFIVYNWQVSHSPRLSPTFIVILVTYIFLPFPHYYGATLAGFIITMLELLISGFIFYSKIGDQFKASLKIYPLAADCIFLLICNAVGVYKLYIDEVNQRRAFLDRRMCIESQIKCLIEEEREDRLLSTVMPRHIITDVKRDIRRGILSSDMRPTNHWPFSELYVVQYSNVSIMFADIINFTKLASNLTSENLVILLDELFGRFDAIAEKHNCMRIRIVGDCYIAVCGLPEYFLDHASNCVEMGFEMIQTIKEIREERKMNIDMRIGIHSGKVISGILGVKKWQFDIWSQDVDIANLMEHTGESGKIHISNVVKDLLGESYEYGPGFGETKSEFLVEKKITTYLVIPADKKEEPYTNGEVHFNGQRRISIYQPNNTRFNRSFRYKRAQRDESELDHSTSQPGSNAFQSSHIMENLLSCNVNFQMEKAIDKMALRKKDQWTKDTGIDPLTLRFSSIDLELPFMRQIDPLFKYYLLAVLLVFLALFSMNILANTAENKLLSLPYVVLVIPLVTLVYAAWHDFVVNVKIDSSEGSSLPQAPKGRINSFLTLISRNVASSLKVRLGLWLTVIVILIALIVINMCFCLSWDRSSCVVTNDKIENARFYTYSYALAVTAVAVFLRIHHMFKLIAYITVLLVFVIFYSIFEDDCIYESFFPGEYVSNRFPVDHSVYLIFIIVCYHLMDRQFEYLSRLDYLWKCQLRQKQEETNITNTVNKFLIQNILPQHVATFYMNDCTKNKVYHEEYTHVAVMFASIPNFSEFYEETDINGHGLKCLQLLNEIICELDCLLNVSQFSRVEKIKVISSTYMAAAGLKPSRRLSSSDENVCLQ